jgi:tetratricopeptide (TPR) repeat protein
MTEGAAGEASPRPVSGGASIGHLTALERAWHAPAASLEQRVTRTRRNALELGAWNFDPAARAVVSGGAQGDPLEQAQAAVTLAPDLPAARMALARALWLHGDAPMSAIRSVVEAMRAIGRHLEASLWFAGSALYLLAVALVVGGLLAILASVLTVGAHAAHDLGHLISPSTPGFARYALLASALLVPLALGEGALGVALVALAVAIAYGRSGRRVALGLAAVAVVAGLYPVIRSAGTVLEAFPSDPVARAAYTTAQGLASPVEVARLDAAADSDPLAARGLAIHARRTGNLGKADAVYQRLLLEEPNDLYLMNNAANVRLELGHMESALDLYRRAVEIEESPIVLFNLSQAYGRSFQVDDLNRTLARAQTVDATTVATFTALQGGESQGFVVDLGLPNRIMWDRVLAGRRGSGIAAEFRAPLAPGRLGRDGQTLAGAVLLIVLVASLLGMRFQPARSCSRCGARMCPRCDRVAADGDLCESCIKLFLHPEKTDRALRIERVNALRDREERLNRVAAVTSMLVPGAAGLLADRPLASLLGTFFFALAVSAVVWRGGVVADPLVAGAAAPFAFLGVAVLASIAYFTIAATSLAARRNR